MRGLIFLILVAAGTLSALDSAPFEVFDRINEPDPKEFRPFQKTRLIRDFCLNVKRFMDNKIQNSERPRNARDLSHMIIGEFDKSHDRCISIQEIRDIAARFQGDLTDYRTLFQHMLDENRNGCVDADELNAIILDCIMPSATWMNAYPEKYEIPFDDEERHRELMEKIQPQEADEIFEEQEEDKYMDRSANLVYFNDTNNNTNPEIELQVFPEIQTGQVSTITCSLFAKSVDPTLKLIINGEIIHDVHNYTKDYYNGTFENELWTTKDFHTSDKGSTIECYSPLFNLSRNLVVQDRRAVLEAEKAKEYALQGLNPAIKEVICSMVMRRDGDAISEIKRIAKIVDADNDEALSFSEFTEFLAGARIPAEETNDIASMIDTDKDGFLMPQEIIDAVDGCPVPEFEEIPVVNKRPMVATDDIVCPSPSAMYGYLRKLAMKFVGSQPVRYENVRVATQRMFTLITGDIEKTIQPQHLDIPRDCVKECWRDLDINQDGLLDLHEFQNIAHDVLEEFIPRRTKKVQKVENTRMNVKEKASHEDIPRDNLEVLNDAVYKILSDMNKRVPENALKSIVYMLHADESVRQFFDKIDGSPNAESLDALMRMIYPKIMDNVRRY